MRSLLLVLARELVRDPRRVSVSEEVEDGVTYLVLRVAPTDRGRVIGRGGRTADALRALVSAVSVKSGVDYEVEVE